MILVRHRVIESLLLAAVVLLAGCDEPTLATSRATAECTTGYVEVTPATAACGFALSAGGALTQDGRMLADPLVVSYQQNADGSTPVGAGKVVLFPASPSGRFRILQACETAEADALCWKVFVFDREAGPLREVAAGKYGPDRWQSWAPDEQHVALVSRNERASWIHVVETPGGRSQAFPGDDVRENWALQPETLAWQDPRRFTVMVARCATCAAAPMEIRF